VQRSLCAKDVYLVKLGFDSEDPLVKSGVTGAVGKLLMYGI